MSEMEVLINKLLGCCCACSPLAQRGLWQVERRWRDAFGRGYVAKAGKQAKPGHEWEALEYHQGGVATGAKAVEEYERSRCERYFVWASGFALECNGELPTMDDVKRLFELLPQSPCLVIMAADCGWTLVFTSEWGIEEPMFARRSMEGSSLS